MRYSKLASLTAATLALGLMAAAPTFAQAPQTAAPATSAPPPAAATAENKMAPVAKSETKAPAATQGSASAKTDLVDINSASAADLEALKGRRCPPRRKSAVPTRPRDGRARLGERDPRRHHG